MKIFYTYISSLAWLMMISQASVAQERSVTVHESNVTYYRGNGPYSCIPDYETGFGVNGTYGLLNGMGTRISYSKGAGGEGYMIRNNVCLYNPDGRMSVWWHGSGWVVGYRAQTGPNTFDYSIAMFNGLNTALPPCQGWSNGYLTGECMTSTVTMTAPSGAPGFSTGATTSTGVVNGRNAYEIPATDSPNGAKATIIWDGSQWVLAYVEPAARKMAETILSVNPTDAGINPPCTGWTNGYSFAGPICEGGATGVLPVSLVSFKAESRDQKTVNLKWETAQERNSLYYGIERSKDMNLFEEIARVQSAGTSNETSHYTLTDETPLKGRSYYRLRQVDKDGTATTYRAVTVRVSGTDAPYPNPSMNGSVQIEATDNAVIRLADPTGRNVEFTRKRINDEVVELTPTHRLQPGIYLITNGGQSHKLIVE